MENKEPTKQKTSDKKPKVSRTKKAPKVEKTSDERLLELMKKYPERSKAWYIRRLAE